MRKHTLHLLVTAALGAQFGLPAIADDGIMVVTGTRTQRSLMDTPVRTEVITAQDLEQSHARDLSEALENIPGVTLRPIHGKTGDEVSMQGFDGERVLILVDGMPVSASTGSRVDLSQLGVLNIKQIEIVRGAVSALYGSEAMGGVINIITENPTSPFGFKVTADGGSYGEQDVADSIPNDGHLQLVTHKRFGDAYVQFATDHRELGGTDLTDEVPGFTNPRGSKANYSLTLGYEFANGGRLRVTPTYYNEDINQNYASAGQSIDYILKNKAETANRANLNVNYVGPLTDEIYLTTYVISEVFENETRQSIISNNRTENHRETEMGFTKGEMQFDIPMGDNHLITTGLVANRSYLTQRNRGVSEINPDKPTQENLEFYIQDDIFLTDRLEVLPSFRVQHDSDFGGHFSPKINLMYTPESLDEYDVKIRAGAGTGYRVPDLKERYYIFDHSANGYMVLGNPELDPETSTSIQFGVDAKLADGLLFDINLYRNDTENLITTDFEGVQQGIMIFRYQNQAETFSQGADLQLNLTKVGNWSGFAGYSYLDAEDKESGNSIVKLPQHQFKFNVNYHLDALNTDVSLYGRFESKSFANSDNDLVSPSHSVFDLKVNTWLTDQIKIFGGVDNLTDTVQDYAQAGNDYRPSKGRYVYLGLTYDY
uniref:TonB-dependent receptor plug domain-containing protein n=1 Tax=Thaumasiovibrio occultus TaxID=1891184 RepID=UPI000B363F81|nr:TonB-dependent receptor [Thaumasiovibrio occultus]